MRAKSTDVWALRCIGLTVALCLSGATVRCTQAAPETTGAAKPPLMANQQTYLKQEFDVVAGSRKVVTRVMSPPAGKLAADPLLLLSMAMDRNTSLAVEPYNLTAQRFLETGNRAASFDLPNHGSRIDKYGEGITGMRNAFIAGQDPFAAFLQDATAVIDRCIADGLAKPGRIVVCGTSRAGYLALRLLAVDGRVAAAAAYAPVTDWRDLTEFAADKGKASVAELRLSQYAEALAGKPVFMIIGNHDARVSTESCCRFYLDLAAANRKRGLGDAMLNFQLQDSPGHSSQNAWHDAGAAFLQKAVAAPSAPDR